MTFKDKEKEIIEYIEKPKLTREERDFLEMFEYVDTCIARDRNGTLKLFEYYPKQESKKWYSEICDENHDYSYYGICLNSKWFPFITWESGKAWSKKELMELEVVE